jgi:hypothetical protein
MIFSHLAKPTPNQVAEPQPEVRTAPHFKHSIVAYFLGLSRDLMWSGEFYFAQWRRKAASASK